MRTRDKARKTKHIPGRTGHKEIARKKKKKKKTTANTKGKVKRGVRSKAKGIEGNASVRCGKRNHSFIRQGGVSSKTSLKHGGNKNLGGQRRETIHFQAGFTPATEGTPLS